MNYAAILAGGTGRRMGGSIPKQFMKLCGVPIIILTIRRVLSVFEFDRLIIAVHPEWEEHLYNLITEYSIVDNRISIIHGGIERLDTVLNVVAAIERNAVISDEDCIVIHDAVRPFVSQSILKNSLEALKQHDAVVAALPAVDTMLWCDTFPYVTSMPNRNKLFYGQAPDSFRLKALNRALSELTEEEKKQITGTAQICMLKGVPIFTIPGDKRNIKITVAEALYYATFLYHGENGL